MDLDILSTLPSTIELRNWSGRVMGLDDYESDAALAGVQLFRDYPEPLLRFASACCALFMLIGIPGNLVTIIALARCKKVRNATAILIINLSCCDLLLSCFNQPLAASTFWRQSWTHGKILCRLFPMTRYALFAVSLFTVLAITLNRYILISHPILYPKLFKNRNLSLIIASIWMLSLGSVIPTYFEVWGRFSLDPVIGSCTIIPDLNDRSPKKALFVSAFLLPSIAIIVCYARILWIVRKTARKSRGAFHVRPLSDLGTTNIAVTVSPRTMNQVVPQFKDRKAKFSPSCLSPELTSSCNDSSSREDNENKCPPQSEARSGSSTAKRFRQSFIATFKRSTVHIRPRMPTKKDKKLLTMIVAIMVAFCVCHLPITLTKTIFQEFTSHPYANIAGYVLIYTTTCINPIIYVVMSNEYRQAYKSMLKCGR